MNGRITRSIFKFNIRYKLVLRCTNLLPQSRRKSSRYPLSRRIGPIQIPSRRSELQKSLWSLARIEPRFLCLPDGSLIDILTVLKTKLELKYFFIFFTLFNKQLGWAVDQLVKATSREVAGSIPDGVIGIFHWHNPFCRTMALELTKPLTEMIIRNISWG